ncbi:MAG: sulfotransferase [Pseudomonadota bacterium]
MSKEKSIFQKIRDVEVTGPLDGVTLVHWLRLLIRHGLRQTGIRQALIVALVGIRNSRNRFLENMKYGARIRATKMEDPIFIIGHWRSGTTHLHNLFALDDQLAYPTHYEVYHPHTFLTTEEKYLESYSGGPKMRRPQDNIEVDRSSPAEDEFALISLTKHALYLSFIFPEHAQSFGDYLDFKNVSDRHVRQWQMSLDGFLRKVSTKHAGKRLVLKSPGHTARIKLLLDLYPNAKFVHIHRNPYSVFRSVEHTQNKLLKKTPEPDEQALQHAKILATYTTLHNAFFEQKSLIPKGNFFEVGFTQLENDPVGEMQRIYDTLGLPAFEKLKPALDAYAESVANYKKNAFPALPEAVAERVAKEWHRSFTEWGYLLDQS